VSIVLRDQFILEMEDNLKETVGLGFKNATKWQRVYRMEKTDKRRVEVDQYVHPSVVAITKEGAPLNRLTVRRGYNSYVVPDTLTGEVKISHEFMRDNRYPEIEKGAFGLGKAMQRKRYKDAMTYIYNGFGSVTSPDQQPVFSSSHALVNPIGPFSVGDNLLNVPLSTDGFDSAITKLLTIVDENGDVCPSDLTQIQLIVPPYNARQALQIVGSTHEPENMNNAVNVYSGSFGEYDVEVVVLPLLAEAPSSFNQKQWYVREVSMAENVFYEREEPETWMVQDQNSLCVLHQCKDSYGIVWHDWRGWVGSKGG
jgi:hypothetical protein